MTDPAPGARGDGSDAGDSAAAAERHGAGGSPRPGEEELFAALDRTRADLAAAPPAPPRAPSRRRVPGARRRWLAAAAAGLTAAAAVLAVVVLAPGSATAPGPTPTAAPPVAPTGGAVVLASADLPQALRSGLGARDATADPAARSACFAAHGLPAGTVPLGSRAVVLDGRPGTLYVLATGRAAVFRLLVVGPGCAPGSPDTLGDVTVGG